MKRLIVALALGLLLFGLPKASMASVSNLVGQLGVYNTTDSRYGLEVDNLNSFYFSPTGASILWPGTTSTTNQTLTIANSGQVIVMTGTSDNTRYTLPTAVVGMRFEIIADVAKILQITPQSTDTINYSSLTAGQGLKSSSAAIGDRIALFCAVANKWSVEEMSGTWAHTGANP